MIYNIFSKLKKTLISRRNTEIDLDTLVQIRKNIEKEYSQKDIEEYTLKLFENSLKKYKAINAEEFNTAYSEIKFGYDWFVFLETKDIKIHFFGLTDLDILKAINNQEFKNKLEESFKKSVGKNVLSELSEKTEFEFEDIEYQIRKLEDRLKEERYSIASKDNLSLHGHLYIKFKY